MSEEEQSRQMEKHRPFRVRLPGFIAEQEIGLGDVIRRATTAIGIGSCGGCQRRAAALNSRVVITGRRARQDVR